MMINSNSRHLVPDSQKKHASEWLLLGICGAGMRSFAEMLRDAGEDITGTDIDNESLVRLATAGLGSIRTVPWSNCFDEKSGLPRTVVHSLAVPSSLPFLSEARTAGVKVVSLPEALGARLRDARQICVAGTHGKTTTSGMIWWVLSQSGRNPAGFIGGEFNGLFQSGSFGHGKVAVIESCEYREAFLHLTPYTIVLTGIEPDHFDCFPDHQFADNAFRAFIDRLPPNGNLIVNAVNGRSVELAQQALCRVSTFGRSTLADWIARPMESRCPLRTSPETPDFGEVFDVLHRGRKVTTVHLRVAGKHNIENALAAFAAAYHEGLEPEEIALHLSTFRGMRRRFEHRGVWNGIDLVDDYAHHPSAIQATLDTAKSVFPDRRLIAVFEPHQVSRTENLFFEFVQALSGFHESLILPVLPARELASSAQCCRLSGKLVRQISEAGGRAFLMANLDQVPGRLDHAARPGDVVITMGAGRTHQIHDEIHRRLYRDSAA